MPEPQATHPECEGTWREHYAHKNRNPEDPINVVTMMKCDGSCGGDQTAIVRGRAYNFPPSTPAARAARIALGQAGITSRQAVSRA